MFSCIHLVSVYSVLLAVILYLGFRSLGLPLVEQVTDQEVGESNTSSGVHWLHAFVGSIWLVVKG